MSARIKRTRNRRNTRKVRNVGGTSRRRFLVSASGATLALPFLEALRILDHRPARAAEPGQTPLKRVVYWYTPNGHNMDDWTPAATGSGYQLSPILQPMAAHKANMTVVSGLWNYGCQGPVQGHAGSSGAFLTCAELHEDTIYNAISADQIAAAHIGADTPFSSLELGMEAGTEPNGYSANISWAAPQTPRPKVVDPGALFTRLFGGATTLPPEEVARRNGLRLSVLDSVATEIAGLEAALPGRDRQKLQEYTDGLRELEKTIQKKASVVCEPGDPPAGDDDFVGKMTLMLDLMVKAFECDLTRVQSFMLGTAASNREYPWIGIDEWHHGLSHHAFDGPTLAKLTEIGQWQSMMFAGFLDRLALASDPDGGSLLDSTVVLYGSGMSDGHYHLNEDLPLVVAGGSSRFNHGQHLRVEEAPFANLHIGLLHSLGLTDLNSFGVAGNGPLAGLLS